MNHPRDMDEQMIELERKIEDNLKRLQQRCYTSRDASSQTDSSKEGDMAQGKDPMNQPLLDPRIAELNACLKEELRNAEELVRNKNLLR